jgi:serine/threonine-protein kinase
LVFAAAVYGSVAVFAPFRLVQLGAPITVSLMLATSVDQLLTFATEKKAPLRAVALIWPVTNFLALPDMFMWLGWGEVLGGLHPGVIGVGFLVLAQSLVLSREHAASQVMTDRLNQALAARIRELEVRQREVQRLNDELRHQLAERSKELERLAPAVATGEERMLESGELIAERYRVVKRIALGATGEVLEVLRESDGVRLAMKVLQRNEPSDTARLAREARLIATLQHENLVSIVDVGMSGDSLFLVMPLAIASVRDERPRYGDRAWATTMLLQVAGGLEALHAAGVVHRDVKPGNVLLMSPGRYQLADLGAATPQYPLEDEHQTTSLRVLGTPIYMAPELYDGRPVTVKVDVFSFAVMALEVLTGHVPRLNGQPMGKALMQHAEPSLPALDVFDASTGPWFRRALAVDASVRPTITELKAALLRWATTTV